MGFAGPPRDDFAVRTPICALAILRGSRRSRTRSARYWLQTLRAFRDSSLHIRLRSTFRGCGDNYAQICKIPGMDDLLMLYMMYLGATGSDPSRFVVSESPFLASGGMPQCAVVVQVQLRGTFLAKIRLVRVAFTIRR